MKREKKGDNMGYYDPVIHHRRSIRLKGYDYSQPGAYFVTLCAQGRECLFGKIENGEMILNDIGKIVADEWSKSAEIRDEIDLGEWVIMPNHFHGIVIINENNRVQRFCGVNRPCRVNRPVDPTIMNAENGSHYRPVDPTFDEYEFNEKPGPRPKSLASLLAGFKSSVTVRVNDLRHTPGAKIWQRNYYERIIRNKMEYQQKTEYILKNPLNWKEDNFFCNLGL